MNTGSSDIDGLFATEDKPPQVEKSEKCVLVVDDSAMMRRAVSAVVEQMGYQAIEAADGEEALVQARSHQPDLIVLDVKMPKKGGIGVLQSLRSSTHLKNTPVIMLTMLKEPEIMREVVKEGVKDYLVKPPNPNELKKRIRKYLE